MNPSNDVLYRECEGVAEIKINRPEVLNALSAHGVRLLTRHLLKAWRRRSVRSVFLTGTGRAFCTGHDLRQLDGVKFGRKAVSIWIPLIDILTTIPKPVVAAINGTAVGAGWNMALACDLTYVVDDAMLGQSFVWIGASPDTGAHALLRQSAGEMVASELLYLGKKITGRKACDIGLVCNSFPNRERLNNEALKVAKELAKGPTSAYQVIKEGIRNAKLMKLQELMMWEADKEEDMTKTCDFREGIAAFLEKRAAKFGGY